jgi:hypothetical protein
MRPSMGSVAPVINRSLPVLRSDIFQIRTVLTPYCQFARFRQYFLIFAFFDRFAALIAP